MLVFTVIGVKLKSHREKTKMGLLKCITRQGFEQFYCRYRTIDSTH